MTATMSPFSEACYPLPSCTLHSLAEEGARFLSTRVALMDPWLTLGYSAEGLLRYLLRLDPALFRFEIVVAGESSGLVCVRYPWLRGPYLEMLAVLREGQGRGVGRDIVSWMMSQCAGRALNLWTLTSSSNSVALSFYRSVGFTEIASLPDLIRPRHDEILLRKIVE
jgi:diamine N-acetyltransferase